jgi:hypothetical protein
VLGSGSPCVDVARVAVPLIEQLCAALGRRGLPTATIELPDGGKITREMDDADLERLVRGLLPADP